MKIRIEDNSIRLRLRRSEVLSLVAEGQLTATTRMPGGHFKYELKLSEAIDSLTALKTEQGIRIELPLEKGRQWGDSEQVGFEEEVTLEDGEVLRLLVEKDFVCLDRDLTSQQDQYPNPKAGSL